MKIPELLIYLLLLGGILSTIFLQNSRSIYIRCIGVFIILATIFINRLQDSSINNDIPTLLLSSIYCILAFLSDSSSASLRTWYFGVSNETMRITFYSILFCLLFLPLAFGFTVVPSLLLGTMIGTLIGEIMTNNGKKNFSRILKSIFGTLIGLYGMGIKVLLGLLMIDTLLYGNFIDSLISK
ncbi:MAG: DUF456 domain-containing protein [Candidatus Sericytochromatia bacterium]